MFGTCSNFPLRPLSHWPEIFQQQSDSFLFIRIPALSPSYCLLIWGPHTHTHKYVSFHSGLEVWHELSKQHWWPWSYWSSISSQWFSWHAIFIQSVIWIHAAQRCQCHTCSYLSTILLFLHMAYNMIRWRWSSSWYSLLNLGGSDMNCSLNYELK